MTWELAFDVQGNNYTIPNPRPEHIEGFIRALDGETRLAVKLASNDGFFQVLGSESVVIYCRMWDRPEDWFGVIDPSIPVDGSTFTVRLPNGKRTQFSTQRGIPKDDAIIAMTHFLQHCALFHDLTWINRRGEVVQF